MRRVQFLIVVVACVAITGWATAQTVVTIINGRLEVRSTASNALVSRGWMEIEDYSTTPGPNMTLDSTHVAATGNMGSVLFQLGNTLVASVSSRELSGDTYGLTLGCYNVSLGHRVCATLTGDGAFTLARQPGFLVYNSTSDVSQPDGTTIGFDVEVSDTWGQFASNTFTAPVTGTYLLCLSAHVVPVSSISAHTTLVTSNRSYKFDIDTDGSVNTIASSGCVFADMDVSDTAHVTVNTLSGTVQVVGSGSPYVTYFSGRLMP